MDADPIGSEDGEAVNSRVEGRPVVVNWNGIANRSNEPLDDTTNKPE